MYYQQNMRKAQEGFTLLELLIVITIIAILSVALVFILNPAETLQKSRDTQRMADLSTLKTAIGIYLTSTSTPLLDNVANNLCLGGTGNATVWYSADQTTAGSITDTAYPTGFAAFTQRATAAASAPVDGTGWVPVKLTSIIGGSPISSMPADPVNKLVVAAATNPSTLNALTYNALTYRYACRLSPLTFEINAKLESAAYGVGGSDDKSTKDGGNNANLYEVGTDLTILPGTPDF
ncbi:MAG: type II secretion system protein [Patescibacteria group bacterium]|nr:type II secretion system protein [Patescibacteria group bacterium]